MIAAFGTTFVVTMLLVVLYSAILSSIIGAVVYIGRFSSIAGSLTHAILGGVGISTWLGTSLWWGAIIAAIFLSFILAFVNVYHPRRLEVSSNIIWGGGMAVGILFTSLAPGYQQNLSNFLFGNIVLVSSVDAWVMLGSILFSSVILCLFLRQFFLLWFSPIFARIQRLNLLLLWFFAIFLVALGVICLVKTIGMALVLVLISVPGHIARMFTTSYSRSFILGFFISLISIFMGLTVSYFFEIPAGASIALLCLGFYIFPLIFRKREL